MIAETLRILRDWLHAGSGASLATLVPLVPRDAGDPVPAVPQVVDETRDGQAAREHAPEVAALPVLQVVLGDDGASASGAPGVRPFPAPTDVQVMLRLIYADDDTDAALRDSSTVLRAMRRSLALLMTTPAGEAARSRNGVQLLGIGGERIMPAFAPMQHRTVTGGMILTVRVQDLHAAT